MIKLTLMVGDITKVECDAIVNAANETLLGGCGVDGAIHRAAGPELLEECRLIGGCRPGDVKVTAAYNLKAKSIFHAVGPVFRFYDQGIAAHLLSSCYLKSILLATDLKHKRIAFPCISTGAYGYPKDIAAYIALNAMENAVYHNTGIEEFIVCCFTQEDKQIYLDTLDRYWYMYENIHHELREKHFPLKIMSHMNA